MTADDDPVTFDGDFGVTSIRPTDNFVLEVDRSDSTCVEFTAMDPVKRVLVNGPMGHPQVRALHHLLGQWLREYDFRRPSLMDDLL